MDQRGQGRVNGGAGLTRLSPPVLREEANVLRCAEVIMPQTSASCSSLTTSLPSVVAEPLRQVALVLGPQLGEERLHGRGDKGRGGPSPWLLRGALPSSLIL